MSSLSLQGGRAELTCMAMQLQWWLCSLIALVRGESCMTACVANKGLVFPLFTGKDQLHGVSEGLMSSLIPCA